MTNPPPPPASAMGLPSIPGGAQAYIEKWSIPVPEAGCWLWLGRIYRQYGRPQFQRHDINAHRLSYMAFVGPIPDGLMICHKCDTPSCVNPDHLYAGTMSDNMHDASNRKRFAAQLRTHCSYGHELTPENTSYRAGRLDSRECRTCRRKRDLARWHLKHNPSLKRATEETSHDRR